MTLLNESETNLIDGVNYTFRYSYQGKVQNFSVVSQPLRNNYFEVTLTNGTVVTKGGFLKVTLNAGASAADNYVREVIPLVKSEGWTLMSQS